MLRSTSRMMSLKTRMVRDFPRMWQQSASELAASLAMLLSFTQLRMCGCGDHSKPCSLPWKAECELHVGCGDPAVLASRHSHSPVRAALPSALGDVPFEAESRKIHQSFVQ